MTQARKTLRLRVTDLGDVIATDENGWIRYMSFWYAAWLIITAPLRGIKVEIDE
jgi:hypothetical protein